MSKGGEKSLLCGRVRNKREGLSGDVGKVEGLRWFYWRADVQILPLIKYFCSKQAALELSTETAPW